MSWRGAMVAVASCTIACSALVDLDGLRGEAGVADAGGDVVVAETGGDAFVDASSSIAFVQQAAGDYSSTGLSFLSPVTDGDAVIVISLNSVSGSVSASDANSNTYQRIIDQYATLDGGTVSMFVAFGVKGGFSTVFVSPPGGGTGYAFYAAEYRGISVFDGKGTGSTQSTGKDALVSSSVSTTAVPELLFAYAHSLATATAGTQFTARSNFGGDVMEDRIVMLAGSYQANATISNESGDILFACFH